MRTLYLGSLVVTLVLAACDARDVQVPPTAPTAVAPFAPAPPSPPRNVDSANWLGDATVLSISGSGGCGWGTAAGEERKGVLWRVAVHEQSILLDEDMSNWPTDHIPFSGTLNGHEFSARYYQGDDYARWVCQFREATLEGRFSPDFSTFEAMETLVWGVPGRETVVRRKWLASRM